MILMDRGKWFAAYSEHFGANQSYTAAYMGSVYWRRLLGTHYGLDLVYR